MWTRGRDHDGLLEGTDNLLEFRLRKMWTCSHQHEYVADGFITQSDTEILKWYCPDCKRIRSEEIVGNLSRAMADFNRGPDDAA